MRYGRVQETGKSAEEFRIDQFIYESGRQQFGNGGLNKETVAYIAKNREEIQDVFFDRDTIYILPGTKQFAAQLFNKCVNFDFGGDNGAIADEVDWIKLGRRYWLRLWWD